MEANSIAPSEHCVPSRSVGQSVDSVRREHEIISDLSADSHKANIDTAAYMALQPNGRHTASFLGKCMLGLLLVFCLADRQDIRTAMTADRRHCSVVYVLLWPPLMLLPLLRWWLHDETARRSVPLQRNEQILRQITISNVVPYILSSHFSSSW